jgi:hypothetical protein
MAIATHPVVLEQTTPAPTPEQALCTIFDIFEDSLEKMTPEKRKAWLDGLSETAETLDKRA